MQEWTATETLLYFNSHPHIEDDGSMDHWQTLLLNFNSHPHTEDDLYECDTRKGIHRISIHILI